MNELARMVIGFATALLAIVGLAGVLAVQAQALNDAPPDKAIGIIFCDDFESGDTSAWGSDECGSTLDMPVAVTE